VIGNRPDSIAQALPDGTPRNFSLAAEPHEYIRVVGAEGRSIIAEVDMALLWIDARSGRTMARTLVDTWEPSLRTRYARYRLQMARGPRPVIGDGLVVAATPTGRVVCFDLDPLKASRRWTVKLPDGLAAFRLALWNGRVAVFARQGGFASYARALTAQLFVFDAFSGFEILHDTFPSRGSIEECNLATAGRKLIVSVPQRLLCYDARAGRNLWSIDGRKVGASHFPEVTTMAGRVVALMNRHAIFAADLDTGRILWKKTAASPTGTGSFQRMIRGRDRVFVAHQGALRYSVVCHRLRDGERLWETLISDSAALHTSRDPVPFAQVAGDRLFIVQHLTRRDAHNPRGRALTPSIAAIRISDGKLLRHVGLAKAAGYNGVLGGKISTDPKRATVIGLITESGLIGISADGE